MMGAICECADKTETLSQQFVEQLDHEGDLVVTRLTAPLPDEQRRAIIGHSIRKAKASHDRHVSWADDEGGSEQPAAKAAAKEKRGNTELSDWARSATKQAQRAESERARFWNDTASAPAYPRHERFARRGTARREPERDRAREPVVLSTMQRELNSSIGPAWTSEANGYNRSSN